jgi:hypothetical protein
MYGKGVALSDTLAIKSDDLLNNHLATIILVTFKNQWHSIK